MEPTTEEEMNALHQRIELLVVPLGFATVARCKFLKDGRLYDLSAADLSQIERIERDGLFLVTPDGIA